MKEKIKCCFHCGDEAEIFIFWRYKKTNEIQIEGHCNDCERIRPKSLDQNYIKDTGWEKKEISKNQYIKYMSIM